MSMPHYYVQVSSLDPDGRMIELNIEAFYATAEEFASAIEQLGEHTWFRRDYTPVVSPAPEGSTILTDPPTAAE